MFDKKLFRRFDYIFFMAILLILALSFLVIITSTYSQGEIDSHYLKKQILFVIVGLVAMFVVLFFDYNTFGDYWKLIYIGNLGLLLAVKFFGVTRLGAQRWIPLGFFDLQPSEFAKIAIILTLAKVIDNNKENLNSPIALMKIGVHVGIPFFLIYRQPDLGTALVFVIVTFFMLFVADLDWKIVLGTIGAGVASIPLLWMFMKPYQKLRIQVFLNPELDPLGSGYHVIQSKTAIGSGQLMGRGLFQGTFNKLDFLPERHTDFVFAVVVEEFGLIGALVVILLLFFIVLRAIRIAVKAKDLYGSLIVVGIVSMLTFQIFENIGMTMGIMPVTGIPLPFLTYGGSSMLSLMIAMGLILNVGMRSQRIKF